MAVNKKLKQIYNKIFDGTETAVSNAILAFNEKRDLLKYKPDTPVPAEYKKRYKEFWGRYGNFNPLWGWYYAARNGNYDVRYVPHNIIYTKIDQHFNAKKLGWGFNDKNYYSKIFSGIPQPETLVRNLGNGIFTDENYNQITAEKALEIIEKHNEVICKPTQESGSGRGIAFWKPQTDKSDIKIYLNNKHNADYIIQSVIKQHPDLSAIHPNSINTVRICSILLEDGVHILSACLRMGANKSRVDNVTAGGISCGIHNDGTLDDYGYNYFTGARTLSHPQGFVFKGHSVPCYEKAVKLVKKAHPVIGHFRLVSWDIAIDENGEALLIEANMRKGGINLHQFSNGPLFGDLTEQIMDEVYGKV